MARIAFHTLGCKLNFTETATLARQLVQAGHTITDWEAEAEVYVLNTCSVTHQAEKKAHKLLRQVHRRSPQAKLVVTGCYAQRDAVSLAQLPGVSLVATNAQKPFLAEQIQQLLAGKQSELPSVSFQREWTWLAHSAEGRTRAFLKVQDGCDYKCSFCIVPQTRGPSRSAPPDVVLTQALRIAQEGYREIVLTGINLGDYGKPHGASFLELLQKLEKHTPDSVLRFRLSSIEPNLLSDSILDFIQDSPRWAIHFHLPLQSGSDRILGRMRRRYRRALYTSRVEAIRKRFPLAGIGVDVIVGFPGEKPEDFAETHKFLADLPISYLHVFPYSERPNTPAASFTESVPWSERLARSEILRELSQRKKRIFAESCKGHRLHLLLETPDEGLTENYLRVHLHQPHTENQLLTIHITEVQPEGEVWGHP
ncbi:MAG: tRNA (N(6)-L-threonylcarbamoyladenosine(37)-C(2))-methylthiotransferase MtaB [Bacteroidia bacterium]|nr:tRNA (N(6)-L-threonylcarbamoyladenosine(37)-C(2))-methylthiotransferase MtaB [Bacteroidia bacterium]MDW8235150.1 tRNA (N(6)-L-threonylcarbamoyladenosine(37)-C(2))-methylthiotransferase MtaB [Bacteroidia bacterium]